MTDYAVNAIDKEEPSDDRPAGILGLELRTLKAYIQDVIKADIADGEQETKAIAAKLTTDSGVAGLPSNTGLNDVLLGIYKELFGYVNAQGVNVAGLLSKFAALNNTVIAHTTTLNAHTATLGNHTTSISNLASADVAINRSISTLTTSPLSNVAPTRLTVSTCAVAVAFGVVVFGASKPLSAVPAAALVTVVVMVGSAVPATGAVTVRSVPFTVAVPNVPLALIKVAMLLTTAAIFASVPSAVYVMVVPPKVML